MANIRYQGKVYESREGETLLDALLRYGVEIPFSCRNGVCQVCLQRCTAGTVPEAAQRGVRMNLHRHGYFLPCKCVPSGEFAFEGPRPDDLFAPAVVQVKEMLAHDVCRLRLESALAFQYHAGQFVNLRGANGLTRSYSLASLPQEDGLLELHIKRMPGGAMSNWIFDHVAVGDELEIQGPLGDCCYRPDRPHAPLLLIAAGTGLAPLIGVARDALHSGHDSGIYLYHGTHEAEGLYLHRELLDLCGTHAKFQYIGCVSGGIPPAGAMRGHVHQLAVMLHPDLSGWQVFLAGPRAMVSVAEKSALLVGASRDDIHADHFDYRDLRMQARRWKPTFAPAPKSAKTKAVPAPDPELWTALGEGELMSKILTDFYTRVFDDPLLAPYFRGVTRQRLIEKVYSFMRQLITGEKMYFGERPRNAHHWMVIPDEIFVHREALMRECLHRHGLAEHLVQRWGRLEERFRSDIVKSEPWPRIVDGVELPLNGFDEVTLDVGTICDGCSREIAAGNRVRYHRRLGSTYCAECAVLCPPNDSSTRPSP
jgi:ferredoxin-NADP reductase/truncated hemoglobin YjbI